MSDKTLCLEGLDELESDDVLYWLKATLARDLAAMRVPKSNAERLEALYYARRRLVVGIGKLSIAIGSCSEAALVLDAVGVAAKDCYYDQDGDPPWKPMPNWAAS